MSSLSSVGHSHFVLQYQGPRMMSFLVMSLHVRWADVHVAIGHCVNHWLEAGSTRRKLNIWLAKCESCCASREARGTHVKVDPLFISSDASRNSDVIIV